MKKFFMLISVVFSVTLAVVIGTRISADAIAVIVGIVCGVLATVPTGVIIAWIVRQRDRQFELQASQSRFGNYPPVVVVNGQGTNGYGSPATAPLPLLSGPPIGGRDFKVIGQDSTESVGDVLPSFWDQV